MSVWYGCYHWQLVGRKHLSSSRAFVTWRRLAWRLTAAVERGTAAWTGCRRVRLATAVTERCLTRATPTAQAACRRRVGGADTWAASRQRAASRTEDGLTTAPAMPGPASSSTATNQQPSSVPFQVTTTTWSASTRVRQTNWKSRRQAEQPRRSQGAAYINRFVPNVW